MNKINELKLKDIKFASQLKLIFFFRIVLVFALSSCSYINQNINKKNTLIFESFCDRWLNRRISNKQILKEFSLYNINNLDEIKIVCKKYNHLIKDERYCLDWLNKTYTDEQTLNRFGYLDRKIGLNKIDLICEKYKEQVDK